MSPALPDPADDVPALVAVLPEDIREPLALLAGSELIEVVLDLGRPPEARFPGQTERLLARSVGQTDLDHVLALVGEFTEDHRAGIERTLHRISAMYNRKGRVVGLTLRVGRAVFGTIDLVRDLVETGANLLILGRPGVGKTTKLREAARVLADELGRRVIVVDTSNEIGGDGDVPHPAIGGARRMQVPRPDRQHAVMIEAVENHMPEVIVVDEIGTEAEAHAARTIAERGVQLIGTAHGNTLENLVLNPTLSDLVGGVHTVTLSDEEARRRGTTKTVSERRAPPTFGVVVEMLGRDEVRVHRDTAAAVDRLLAGVDPGGERRVRGPGGAVERSEVAPSASYRARGEPNESSAPFAPRPEDGSPRRLYPYAVSPETLSRAIRDLGVPARVVSHPEAADAVVALRSRVQDDRFQRITRSTGLPIHLVKNDTTAQLRRLLRTAFHVVSEADPEDVRAAVKEVKEAVQRVLDEGVEVALPPRPPGLRRMQHGIISRHRLVAWSEGAEPHRRLVIQPGGEGA